MDLRPLGLYGSGGFESGYEVFVGSGNGRNKHSSSPALSLRPRCNAEKRNNGDKKGPSRDWDKAWSSFKKQGKKTFFSQFNPEKYVSRNPSRSEYPLLEEVDPIKRSERANLRAWTSTTFTLGGAVVLVSVLLLYTILAPLN
ncbi:uncharacterized protein LOC105421514 [Amborella trichopoda]|uniref:uncharacterized protein LOC105421514 n=1 Tax=Amborella trichopoda TaxID=13333 RepID=UPI0005D3DE65|nr:uncharacterized protein LOC105421514 [Amborella trichopoda]|eukprot:XP_011627396.1 uncharacterized protein LOC105421514 [Amborella trichopoda]